MSNQVQIISQKRFNEHSFRHGQISSLRGLDGNTSGGIQNRLKLTAVVYITRDTFIFSHQRRNLSKQEPIGWRTLSIKKNNSRPTSFFILIWQIYRNSCLELITVQNGQTQSGLPNKNFELNE